MIEITATQNRFTGRKFFAIIISFFAVVFVVNFYFAATALRTNSGLVTDDGYDASQNFDRDTAKVKADAARDIHLRLAYADGKVHLDLRSAAGGTVAATALHLTLGHPVSASTDIALQFTPDGDTGFAAPAKLGPGIWEGQLQAALADGTSWSRPVRLRIER